MTYKDSDAFISVVVCHHTGDFIYKFVNSLKESVGVNFECIIVTSDKNLKLVQDCHIYFHEGAPAEKRNYGVGLSKGKFIAFFDDDVEIDKYCLYNLYKCLMIKEAGMAYGKLHKADDPARLDEAGGYITWNGFIWSRAEQNIVDKGQFNRSTKIFSGKSASCMIMKKLFLEIGGFDESFGILGEESDLSWRVWLYGCTVYFEPSATGIHYFNTIYKPPKKYYTSNRVHFNGCRNYITMHLKNLGKEHLWIALINAIIWTIVGLVMIGTLRVRQGANILRGIWYVIRNWKSIMKKRNLIQAERIIPDKVLFRDIYRKVGMSYYFQRLFRYISSGLHG